MIDYGNEFTGLAGKKGRTETVRHTKTKDIYRWGPADTKILINAYGHYHTYLNEPKKASTVWPSIQTTLFSRDFNVTMDQCKNKWNTLPAQYKLDNDTKPVDVPTPNAFYECMDKILGNKPTNSKNLTISS